MSQTVPPGSPPSTVPTLRDLLIRAESFLSERGVPEASVNAEFLMAWVLATKRCSLRAQNSRILEGPHREEFWRLVRERGRRIPLAYVLGAQDFMGMDLKVAPGVLIPRPETEEVAQACILIGQAMGKELQRGLRIMDLGTGSGCIALALASRLPDCFVVAVDASPAAVSVAAANAKRHGLERRIRFLQADFSRTVPEAAASWADMIVSNPPYIPTSRLARLDPEVLQEPRSALDGGEDGLDAIRAIVSGARQWVRSGGSLVLEIDDRQGASVRDMLERGGFAGIEVRRDSQGLERIAIGVYRGRK